MWPFSRKVRRQLGVDIGTSSIKIVELERDSNFLTLTNYGLMDGSDFFGEVPGNSNMPAGLKMSENEIALTLKQMMAGAKIKSKDAVMSIPIFSSFLTIMELPGLNLKELESAIPFEARSYIPIPLAEVVLDWIIVSPKNMPPAPAAAPASNAVQPKVTVLLIAVPKEVVSKYQRIAAAAGLNLAALEAESFSLARSLVGNDLGTIMLVDFGARNTNLTILDQGSIFMSHSADLSGKEITRAVAHSLNVVTNRAEELKKTSGISATGLAKGLGQVISPFIDKLVVEVERMNNLFFKKENKKIEKIILSGGSSGLPGLAEYLSRGLGVEVLVGNPFGRVKFDPALEPVLRRELSSSFAVAVGLAMRET